MIAHEFARCLRQSDLHLGGEISERIEEGWSLTRGTSEVSSSEIRNIYSVRRGILQEKALESGYARSLVTSMDEMLSRLPSNESGLWWYWIRHDSAEVYYLALLDKTEALAGYRLKKDGAIPPAAHALI